MEDFRKVSVSAVINKIMRWPMLFLSPIILSVITVMAYAAQVNIYKSEGIITFDADYAIVDDSYTMASLIGDRHIYLIKQMIYGEPIRKIVNKVWPHVSNDSDPVLYNSYINRLRSRSGIRIEFQKGTDQAVSVSYKSSDPYEAYKVVDATIQTIIETNKADTKNLINTNVSFLGKEVESAKEEIQRIEKEILQIRAGLPSDALSEHDNSKLAANPFASNYSIDGAIKKSKEYGESLSELRFSLLVAEKERKRLLKQLDDGSYLTDTKGLEAVLDLDNDPTIKSTNDKILAKKQSLNELSSKGFKDAHPEVRSLLKEIKNLETLKNDRLFEIKNQQNTNSIELTKLKIERNHRAKIQNKVNEIESIKDRIKATELYQNELKEKGKGIGGQLDHLSRQKAKLIELENSREIAKDSYNQIAKRLQVSERESRFKDGEFGMIIEVAEEPILPTSPLPLAHSSLIFMGLMISCIFSLGLASLLTIFDSSVHTAAELRDVLAVPVLGSIDKIITDDEVRASRIKSLIILSLILVYAIFAKQIIRFFI